MAKKMGTKSQGSSLSKLTKAQLIEKIECLESGDRLLRAAMNPWGESLDRATVTEDRMCKTISEAMGAKKLEGKKRVPDHPVRLKGVDMAAKLTGAYPDQRVRVGGDPDNPIKSTIEVVFVGSPGDKKSEG
jgi:hypothetical protein